MIPRGADGDSFLKRHTAPYKAEVIPCLADAVRFEIDPRPVQAAVDEARAGMAKQQAVLQTSQANLKRILPLAAANAVILLSIVLMIIWALTRVVDIRKEL